MSLRHIAPVEGDYTSAKMTYEWQCFKCGRAETKIVKVSPGDVLFIPSLPDGWVKVNRRLYCPQHKVQLTVLVDGVLQP